MRNVSLKGRGGEVLEGRGVPATGVEVEPMIAEMNCNENLIDKKKERA